MRFPRILNLMANLMCLASRSPKLPTGNRHPRVCQCVCVWVSVLSTKMAIQSAEATNFLASFELPAI